MYDLQWFFRSPRQIPGKGDDFSQLYLLRRDIETCFGIDPNTGLQMRPVDERNHSALYCKAIWPGTMAVLAGIDLLAKFFEGSDNSGGKGKHGVGKRFKKFARKYMRLTKEEANLIYQLRNSLLHSFGLYTEEKDKKWRVNARYYFQLCQGSHELIAPKYKDIYCIDVDCLRSRFDSAIAEYLSDLNSPLRRGYKTRITNFRKMFRKHAKPIFVFE